MTIVDDPSDDELPDQRYARRRLLWPTAALMLLPLAWANEARWATGELVFLPGPLLYLSFPLGALLLAYPRVRALSLFIWFWSIALALILLSVIINLTIAKSPGSPVDLANATARPLAFGAIGLLFVRRLRREMRMPVGSDGYRAHAACRESQRLLARAIKLEVKGQVDEALSLYEDIVTRFPTTEAAKDASSCVAALRGKLSLGTAIPQKEP